GLLAFLLPALIIFIGFQTAGVWPTGERHILTIDLFHQYAPFLAEYRRKLLSLDTLLYSWRGGLGTDFWSLHAYYLASPLNLLILLFPPSQLSNYILFTVTLKTGLTGYTAYYYLRKGRGHEPWTAVLFSMGYALSSYTLAYFWNIMWLDAQILLPILAYTTLLLIKKERVLPYILTLALTLYTNYYVAFFAALFTALYYLVLLTENIPFKRWKDQLAKTILFGGSSVFAAALAGILIIPIYLKLQYTSASGDAWPETPDLMYPPIDLLSRMMVTTSPAVREGLPNLYAGALILLLLPAYFTARHIPLRAKIANGLLLAVLTLSLSINTLNFFWHGMHYPNQLPHRFAFVAIFLLTTMAADAYRAHQPTPKTLATIATGIGLLALILNKIDDKQMSGLAIITTMAVLAIYVAVITTITKREHVTLRWRKKPRTYPAKLVATTTLITLVALELTGSAIYGIREVRDGQVFGNIDGYAAGDFANAVRDAASKIEKDNPGAHPRAEFTRLTTYNDDFLYGYDGVTLFASSFAEAQLRLMDDIGLSTNGINSYAYNPIKPLDIFLGIKYVMTTDLEQLPDTKYTMYYDSNALTVLENKDALAQAFVVLQSAASFSTQEVGYLQNQEAMYEAAFGEPGLYDYIAPTFEAKHGTIEERPSAAFGEEVHLSATSEGSETYVKFTAPKTARYLLAYKSGAARVDDSYTYAPGAAGNEGKHASTQKNAVIDLGVLNAGEEGRASLRIEADKSGTLSVQVAALNDDVLDRAVAKANATPVNITRGSRSLDMTVNAERAGYVLVTSIFDVGWSATVNGESTEIEPFNDSFMLIPIQPGENQISMRFTPIGFTAGLLTTLVALIFLIGLALFEKRVRDRKKRAAHEAEARAKTLEETLARIEHNAATTLSETTPAQGVQAGTSPEQTAQTEHTLANASQSPADFAEDDQVEDKS
ncbi:MAG: YfhO family protein, partial [Actinomycetaceae bacterium]|nr:YfhO family protein [Actinomycetaceae bacterium]